MSDDDAVSTEAAFAEQMVEEGTGDVAVYDTFAGEVEAGDAPVNPLDIPDHYDLPMHGSILACPKCGSDKETDDGKIKGLRTYYHEQGVLHAPCGNRFGWPDVQNLGEHLCRVCDRCGYGWPEEVFHGSA